MTIHEQLRRLPSVDEILNHPEIAAFAARHSRGRLVEWIRTAVDQCRDVIINQAERGKTESSDLPGRVIALTRELIDASLHNRQQGVINATGVLLHTNLGRAPLADSVIARMSECARSSNVEHDLASGRRATRGDRAMRLLAELTGAEDALVVNNCAAATMLALQAVAAGREVVVSRGQLVEIGGGYRLPEVFAASGAVLREVGTTNRTYLRDYEQALSDQTGALIRVHRSNFFQQGFVTEPSLAELVALGRSQDVPVIDDVGSGCLQDFDGLLLNEPQIPASVQAGADLTLFSGDKLFGGPQAGIIVGRSKWVECLRRSPLMRALRVDKMTLAAIEATTEIHLADRAAEDLPLIRMLTTSFDVIRNRCEIVKDHLLNSLSNVSCDVVIEIIECQSEVGGGSVPEAKLRSAGLRMTGVSSNRLSAALRKASYPVIGRVQDGGVLLDLRTVLDDQVDALVCSVRWALTACHGHES